MLIPQNRYGPQLSRTPGRPPSRPPGAGWATHEVDRRAAEPVARHRAERSSWSAASPSNISGITPSAAAISSQRHRSSASRSSYRTDLAPALRASVPIASGRTMSATSIAPPVMCSSASTMTPGRRKASARPGTSVVTTSPTRTAPRERDVYAGTRRSTAATPPPSMGRSHRVPSVLVYRAPRSLPPDPTRAARVAERRSRHQRYRVAAGRAAIAVRATSRSCHRSADRRRPYRLPPSPGSRR